MGNPLRDPQDRRLPRIPEPCALVIFGVTGDLARKKLMPAIYDLANRGLLPAGFSLVGFARRDWEHQDFGELVHGDVVRYEAPNVLALKFVMYGALGGGAPRSLRADNLGKTHGASLLRMWVDVPDNVAANASRRHAPVSRPPPSP